MTRFSTSVMRIDSPEARNFGKFTIVGRVPATCANDQQNSKIFDTEADALTSIMADPWIQSDPDQMIQCADCTTFRVSPAGSPRVGEWVLAWRSTVMPAPAFDYYPTRETAVTAVIRRRTQGE